MGKTKKVEGFMSSVPGLRSFRSPKGHQPRLLRMQAQPKLLESLEDNPIDPFGVTLEFEAHDKVIGIAN